MERLPRAHDSVPRAAPTTVPVREESPDAGRLFDRRGSPVHVLTDREQQIIEMVMQGWSNKRIASELNITSHTVKFHLKSSYRKFGVSSRTGAVCVASRLGLIDFA